MSDIHVEVKTRKCYHCGKDGYIIMPQQDYLNGSKAYRAGAFVQDAFPNLTIDQREQIISGTHPECWIALFGSDIEQEED